MFGGAPAGGGLFGGGAPAGGGLFGGGAAAGGGGMFGGAAQPAAGGGMFGANTGGGMFGGAAAPAAGGGLFGGGGAAAGGGMFGGGAGVQPQIMDPNTNGDVVVPGVPADSISELAWSPTGNIFAASSWDKSVRIWEVGPTGVQPKLSYNHEGPALCCNFSKDGQRIVSGGCDGKVKMNILQTQQEQQIGQHDAPVKSVWSLDEMNNMVVSGSWDKTIRFWDCRQAQPAATLQLPERLYCMDLKFPLMVVGCADRHLLVYNLQNIQANPNPYKSGQSTLKMQTRCVSCFPDKTGYAVGSVEGRVSVAHIEDTSKNFTFKCHRSQQEIFAVHDIDFHPSMGTFVTAGGDGTYVFWDKENRQRLQQSKTCNNPVTCAKFNTQGDMFAYAVSYDWGKGHEGNHPNLPKAIFLHKVTEVEVKPKPKNTRR